MPPKMLTSTAFTFLSREQDAERFGDLLGVGAAADVEEVGRFAAVELDEVHRGHREAGAVDEAADVAVELDVAEARFAGAEFVRVFFGGVAELGELRVAEQGVVVEADLGVEGEQLAGLGDDERVDLDQAAIERDEQLAERLHELLGRADARAGEVELRGTACGPGTTAGRRRGRTVL